MAVVRVLGFVVLAGLLLAAAAWLFQDRLIYLPYGRAGTPAEAGLASGREVTLGTADGLQLAAWFVPAATPAPTAAVLFLPGNAGNRSARAPLAAALSDRGFAVLLVEYRGYGGNPGRPSQAGLRRDALAGREALAHLVGDTVPIVYFGESLGAAVAVDAALHEPPAALVLRSPFTSLPDVARAHYPFVPVALLRDDYEVAAKVDDVQAPVLVLAGERDSIVPLEQSRRVAQEAGARLVVIPGANHNDAALLAGQRLLDAVTTFLQRVDLT